MAESSSGSIGRVDLFLVLFQWQVLLGWSIAAALMLACQHGLYGTWSDTAVMSDHVYELYEAVQRINLFCLLFQWQILLGWSIAATLMLSCQYGLYGTWSDTAVMSDHVYHLYEAVSKTAWSAGLAWVIFACVTGNGGKRHHSE